MTEVAAPEFPPGVDWRPYLRDLYHSGIRSDPAQRRAATRRNPVAFAFLYLHHYLSDSLTGNVSFSPLHLALAEEAVRWVEPGAHRSAWVAPREAGKSAWLFVILPIWALAHGHRKFFLAFSYTKDQTRDQFEKLRSELKDNDLLLNDFPNLRPTSVRTDRIALPGGLVKTAGLLETSLGAGDRNRRPDLMVGDDLETDPAKYTLESKAKTLSLVQESILPMNTRAAVAITGTVIQAGSLLHDVVRASQGRPGAAGDGGWVASEGFDPHVFPALVDGVSMWPARWSTEWLLEQRETNRPAFELNYGLDPSAEDTAKWWTEKSFHYNPAPYSHWRILSVDGAVTEGSNSDPTALAVIAVEYADRGQLAQRVVVEHAEQGHWSRPELRAKLLEWTEAYPRSQITWVAETNQGGNMWEEALSPWPAHVQVKPYRAEHTKRHRAESLHADYARRAVLHAERLPEAEAEMLAWHPKAKADNLIDAIGGGVRLALYGTPGKAPS